MDGAEGVVDEIEKSKSDDDSSNDRNAKHADKDDHRIVKPAQTPPDVASKASQDPNQALAAASSQPDPTPEPTTEPKAESQPEPQPAAPPQLKGGASCSNNIEATKTFLSGLRSVGTDADAAKEYIASFVGRSSSSSSFGEVRGGPLDKQAMMIMGIGLFALIMIGLPLLTMSSAAEGFVSSKSMDDQLMMQERHRLLHDVRGATVRIALATIVVSVYCLFCCAP